LPALDDGDGTTTGGLSDSDGGLTLEQTFLISLSLVVREHVEPAHGDEGLGEELVRRGGFGLALDVVAGGRVPEQRGVGGQDRRPLLPATSA
jgi:hypothetical protein